MPYLMTYTYSCDTITAYATSAEPVRKYYLGFEPARLKNVSVQLTTNAHNQGWASDPNAGIWTYFELAILTDIPTFGEDATPYIRKDSSGNLLTWKSHDVPLNSNWNMQVGPMFTTDSELSKNLQPGDLIGVIAYAQFAEWKLDANQAALGVQADSF